MSTQGRFVWHELVTPDPKAAAPFYAELFGWKTKDVDMGGGHTYTLFQLDGVDVGGATSPMGGSVPPSWLGYATVNDVDEAAEKAKASGGKVMAGPMDIPNVGRFAVLLDPFGAALAAFKATGRPDAPEGRPPVGHFCWDDAASPDPAKAAAFYAAVWGFTVEEKDMGAHGTYHLLKRGDRMAGGLMRTATKEQPSTWFHYVAVKDIEASTKRVATLGGKVIVPATPIPNIGKFSIVADRQGATFALFGE